MFVFATEHPVLAALAVLVAGWLVRFLQKGYTVRKTFHGQAGPPHSWLWGHLKVMGDMMDGDVPTMVHPHVLPSRIRDKYNLGSHFYIDLWPIADPFLAVFDPELAAQFTTDYSAPKYPGMRDFLTPLAGPGDMVSSNGPHWKKWRSIFNPGFASNHLMSLVPGIVDHITVFTDKLSDLANTREAFRLEEITTRLTVDIIGKVALDMQLNTQREDNSMVSALREQVHLVPNSGTLNPLAGWSPIGIYQRWRNSRIMVSYLDKVLEDRLANQDSNDESQKTPRKRTMIDLALESYRNQTASSSTTSTATGLDPDFKTHAITQIRIFIFAGHDTTSSAICYALYLLQKHPQTLAKIRAEHDTILGPISTAPSTLRKDPYIVNKLEYTNAVVKESLRLFPAASGLRTPDETLILRNPQTSEILPTIPTCSSGSRTSVSTATQESGALQPTPSIPLASCQKTSHPSLSQPTDLSSAACGIASGRTWLCWKRGLFLRWLLGGLSSNRLSMRWKSWRGTGVSMRVIRSGGGGSRIWTARRRIRC